MPNGDPHFDVAAQEEWFAPLASVIADFAESHSLYVQKYYHDSCAWDLRFRHPQGGFASVAIYNHAADSAQIGSTWYVDSFAHFTRSLYVRPLRVIPKTPHDVGTELHSELAAIIAVPAGQWTKVASGYEPVWGQYTEQQFTKMQPTYSLPKL